MVAMSPVIVRSLKCALSAAARGFVAVGNAGHAEFLSTDYIRYSGADLNGDFLIDRSPACGSDEHFASYRIMRSSKLARPLQQRVVMPRRNPRVGDFRHLSADRQLNAELA